MKGKMIRLYLVDGVPTGNHLLRGIDLLPKLLSGEIQVTDAQKVVGEAV